MAETNVLASAAASASYNMLLQLVFRLLTFVLNAFVLRYISKDMLGVVNVRLTLLYTTVLFVSREAFRRACLSKTVDSKWPQVINLLWCTVPISMACASVFGYIWAYVLEQPDLTTVPHYRIGVMCFAISTVVEMLAEPLWVVGQNCLFVRLKVLVEGGSLALRCILTIMLVMFYPELGIIGFSIAQLIFTAVYTASYYTYFIYYITSGQMSADFPFQHVSDMFPSFFKQKPVISWGVASLTWSFFKQSFLKQILTEGERYVMTVFDVLSFADQGIYDIINNLGSLAARFIFLPVEDSSYLFFSQTLTRGHYAHEQEKEAIRLSTSVLRYLLKVVTLIGLTFLVFGYAYSFLLLDLYGGALLSSGTGPLLLRWYCVYVLLLAVNGITECFAFATMSKQDVDRYNHKMLVFSAVFLTSSWYLTTQLGSIGFILANCLNMAIRIAHSLYYTKKFYSRTENNPLQGLVPAPLVLCAFLASFIITFFSENIFCCDQGLFLRLVHIGIGGVCLLTVLGTVYFCEKKLVTFVLEQYRTRVKSKSENATRKKKSQ